MIQTPQQYLDQKYPTKEDKEKVEEINLNDYLLTNRISKSLELDLNEYKNLKKLIINGYSNLYPSFSELNVINHSKLKVLEIYNSNLIFINLKELVELESFSFHDNNVYPISSLDFLNQLPNPQRLKVLELHNDKIGKTNIQIFNKFTNLEVLKIGTPSNIKKGSWDNYFWGSLKGLTNLKNLKFLGIEGTSVDNDLEYLPWGIKKIKYYGCNVIYQKLRKFNHDLTAWRLAHPHKMFKANAYLFVFDNKEWMDALEFKIKDVEMKLEICKEWRRKGELLEQIKPQEIKILELKLQNLELIKKIAEEGEIHNESMNRMGQWYRENKEIKTINRLTQTDSKQIEAVVEIPPKK